VGGDRGLEGYLAVWRAGAGGRQLRLLGPELVEARRAVLNGGLREVVDWSARNGIQQGLGSVPRLRCRPSAGRRRLGWQRQVPEANRRGAPD